MNKMLDKDKLILLFNVYTGDINDDDVYEYVQETAKGFKNYFDDSIKCIFAITKDETKPAVQNITDFPENGISIIEELIKFKEEGDDKALNMQFNILKSFINEYNNIKNENIKFDNELFERWKKIGFSYGIEKEKTNDILSELKRQSYELAKSAQNKL